MYLSFYRDSRIVDIYDAVIQQQAPRSTQQQAADESAHINNET